jgi:glycerol 2-dehydrogenase (NADP+)
VIDRIPIFVQTVKHLLVAKGFVVLPKSVTPARIATNFTGAIAAAAKLEPADIEQLDSLAAGGKQRRYIFPAF